MEKAKKVVIEKLDGYFDEFENTKYSIHDGIVYLYDIKTSMPFAHYSMRNIVCVYYENEEE